MSNEAPHEELRRTRLARGLEVDALARRTGVREPVIVTIESGRWRDLPRGLYGRAAIRSYAGALGVDADRLLADVEPLLPPLEDPIAGLARVRGLRHNEDARRHIEQEHHPETATSRPLNLGRSLLATTIDAICIGAAVLVLPLATTVLTASTPSALRAAAVPFGAMAALITCAYYLVFAGIGGETPGERAARLPHRSHMPVRCTMRAARTRAIESASADARAITVLGAALAAHVLRHTPDSGRHDDGSVDGQRLAI